MDIKHKYENDELYFEIESLYENIGRITEKTSAIDKLVILSGVNNALSSGFSKYFWDSYIKIEQAIKLIHDIDKQDEFQNYVDTLIEKYTNKEKEEILVKTFELDNLKFEVRVLKQRENIWFCLKDVCKCLGITNITQASQRIDEEDKAMFDIGLVNGAFVNFVNESGLYTLLIRSDKKEAKPFRKWVTSEVLPSIRRTGMYMTENVFDILMNNPTKLGEMLIEYGKVREELRRKEEHIKNITPKVEFADTFLLQAKEDVSFGEFAKLTYERFGLGRNRLFTFLRSIGILDKNNIPYQKYMKYFNIVESTKNGKDFLTPLIKVEGQKYLLNKIQKEFGNV